MEQFESLTQKVMAKVQERRNLLISKVQKINIGAEPANIENIQEWARYQHRQHQLKASKEKSLMELNKLQQDVGFLPLLSTEQDVLIQTYITKTMEGLSRLLIGGENASNQHEEEKEVESNKHQSPVESIIEKKN